MFVLGHPQQQVLSLFSIFTIDKNTISLQGQICIVLLPVRTNIFSVCLLTIYNPSSESSSPVLFGSAPNFLGKKLPLTPQVPNDHSSASCNVYRMELVKEVQGTYQGVRKTQQHRVQGSPVRPLLHGSPQCFSFDTVISPV